ncbi:MAG TPA: protein kinase [Phycisphaerae bacterium]|nr:protein kinase [Phycisphaerae bacterium]HRW52698.1 protein kinase [Phycisphaerae bacterium]
MSSSLHQRAGEIFLEAIALPTESRAGFVVTACAEDSMLREEVESLLRASEETLPILDAPHEGADSAISADDADRFIGSRFGGFRIIGKVASGGMGVVYRAEQDQPHRIVAIKVLRHGLSGRSAVRRFQFEVQALGQLRHAGIAQIHEAGVETIDGVSIPYFAMEYVEGGRSITSFAVERRLSTRDRLTLIAKVCDAVHSGHQKGIIHRDLKPDNVLVDDSGQPKVIDFGVARATDADIHVTTQHTEMGRLVGTLPYMSPEQLSGDPAQVDTRADVYALGVVLYELLAGQLPIHGSWESVIDAIDAIRERPPRKLGVIDPHLRGDLETIAAKAVEKDKSRRYQSAAELAADIRRFLNDEPISARPPTAIYQLRMFARRNRGLVRGAALGGAAILIGVIISVQQAFVATSARDFARREEAQARYQSYLAGVAAASAAIQNHDTPLARRSLAQAPEALRGWEWRYLNSQLDESVLAIHDARPLSRRFVRFLDDNIIGAWDIGAGAWRRWDARSGERLEDLPADGVVTGASSGTAQLTIQRDEVRVELLKSGESRAIRFADMGMPDNVEVHLSENARWLSINSLTKAIVINVETGKRSSVGLQIWPVGNAPSAISARGQFAVGTGLNGMPAILDLENGKLRPLEGATAAGADVVFDGAGERVVGVLNDATVRLWDATTGRLIATGHGHTNGATIVRFSPDGTMIATAGRDRTLRLWTADTLEPLAVFHGHDDAIATLEFDATGARVVTAGADSDRSIHVWDVSARGDRSVLNGHDGYVYPVAISDDQSTIASGAWDNEIRLWDANRLMSARRLIGHTGYLTRLEFNRTGRRLMSFGADETVRVWDVERGVELRRRDWRRGGACLAWHPDGVHIYLPGTDTEKIAMWNSETDEIVDRPFASIAEIRHGPVSADGRFAIVELNGEYQAIRTLDATRALPIPMTRIHRLGPAAAASRLAMIRRDDPCAVDVWDLDAKECVGTLRGHSGRSVWDIAFTPDATRIMTAGDDQVIRVWDAVTMDEIVQLRGHKSYVWSLVFSANGDRLISGSGDGTVRVWDTLSVRDRFGGRGRTVVRGREGG